jgi:hypothetical protein
VKVGFKEMRLELADWIQLAQDLCQWRTLINAVPNSKFPDNKGDLFTG